MESFSVVMVTPEGLSMTHFVILRPEESKQEESVSSIDKNQPIGYTESGYTSVVLAFYTESRTQFHQQINRSRDL